MPVVRAARAAQVPQAAAGLVERGLLRLDTSTRWPRLFFTEAGLVVLQERGGYALTGPGADLLELLLPLSSFAEPWAQGLLAED